MKIEYKGWKIYGELSYFTNKTVSVDIYNETLNIGMKIERDVEKTTIINTRSDGSLWGHQVLYDEEKTLKELVKEAKIIVDFLVVAKKRIHDDTLSLLHMPTIYDYHKEKNEKKENKDD